MGLMISFSWLITLSFTSSLGHKNESAPPVQAKVFGETLCKRHQVTLGDEQTKSCGISLGVARGETLIRRIKEDVMIL